MPTEMWASLFVGGFMTVPKRSECTLCVEADGFLFWRLPDGRPFWALSPTGWKGVPKEYRRLYDSYWRHVSDEEWAEGK